MKNNYEHEMPPNDGLITCLTQLNHPGIVNVVQITTHHTNTPTTWKRVLGAQPITHENYSHFRDGVAYLTEKDYIEWFNTIYCEGVKNGSKR